MAKPEWGTKRICLSCSAKFYDLTQDPITCPSCGATFKAEDFTRGRRGKGAVAEKPAPKSKPKRPVPSEDDDDVDDVLLGDDDDDDLDDEDDEDIIEDTTDLGDDEDDVHEVVVGVDPDDEDDKTV